MLTEFRAGPNAASGNRAIVLAAICLSRFRCVHYDAPQGTALRRSISLFRTVQVSPRLVAVNLAWSGLGTCSRRSGTRRAWQMAQQSRRLIWLRRNTRSARSRCKHWQKARFVLFGNRPRFEAAALAVDLPSAHAGLTARQPWSTARLHRWHLRSFRRAGRTAGAESVVRRNSSRRQRNAASNGSIPALRANEAEIILGRFRRSGVQQRLPVLRPGERRVGTHPSVGKIAPVLHRRTVPVACMSL